MTKARGVGAEEEDEGCESSRGKESKFVVERSDSGMNSSGGEAKSSDDGSAGHNANNSAGANNSSDADSNAPKRESSNRDRAGGRSRYRVPSNLCRDFIFYSCKRRGCKFEHPDPESEQFKEARASRPGLAPREEERSRSPVADHDGGDKPIICRDYLRNMCYRGKDCRYMHPAEDERDDLPWPQLCIDYRTGDCKRFDCRFLHYGSDDEQHYISTGTVRRDLWHHFINISLKDSKILKSRPVCKLFLQSGSCSMNVCRYRHVSQKEYDEDMYQIITQMVFEKVRRTHPDISPPNLDMPPPSSDGDLLPPPPPQPPSGGSLPLPSRDKGPYPPPPPFRDYPDAGDLRSSRPPSYDWERRSHYSSFPPKSGDPSIECDQLNRENSELRRMMAEDSTRYKVDVDRLTIENSKLQDQLNYVSKSGSGNHQQMNMIQQENAELSAKMKGMNDWSVELQAKYSTTRRECDELRDSVKVLNLELATVNEEKIKLKRKSDELEAKLQVSMSSKEEGNLAIEKKEYLENKLKQYYEGMKRCESDFVNILEKNFHITTPNVMSYFPSWTYLVSFVTEIVTQINNTSTSSIGMGAFAAPVSYGGYGSSSTVSNYSLPPPTVLSTTTTSSAYGGYQQQTTDPTVASSSSQQGGSAGGYGSSYYGYGSGGGGGGSNYSGNNFMDNSNAGPYGTSSFSGNQYVSSSSYGNAAAAPPVTNAGGIDKSRLSSKSGLKKDSSMLSSPWKKRN